jgi:hypothetical protein
LYDDVATQDIDEENDDEDDVEIACDAESIAALAVNEMIRGLAMI